MLRTPTFVLSLAAAFALSAPAGAQDLVQRSPAGDREMTAAEQQARDTLPIFWRRIQSGDPQIDLALVKVGFPTSAGATEYLWVAVGPDSDKDRRGQLLNEPEEVPKLHAGQVITFNPERIGDWAYRKAGKFYGQFTTRVMISRADPKAAAEQSAALASTPLEPESK